jgi:pantothenate synthetase
MQKVREISRPGLAVADLHDMVQKELHHYPLIRLDYFDVRSSAGLRELATLRPEDEPRAFIAAFCGSTRLIDNLPVL